MLDYSRSNRTQKLFQHDVCTIRINLPHAADSPRKTSIPLEGTFNVYAVLGGYSPPKYLENATQAKKTHPNHQSGDFWPYSQFSIATLGYAKPGHMRDRKTFYLIGNRSRLAFGILSIAVQLFT